MTPTNFVMIVCCIICVSVLYYIWVVRYDTPVFYIDGKAVAPPGPVGCCGGGIRGIRGPPYAPEVETDDPFGLDGVIKELGGEPEHAHDTL